MSAVDRCRPLSTVDLLSTVNPCRPVDPVVRGPLSTPVNPGLADNIYPLAFPPAESSHSKGVPLPMMLQRAFKLQSHLKKSMKKEPSTSTQPDIISTCIAVMMAGCVLVPGSSQTMHPSRPADAAHKHTASHHPCKKRTKQQLQRNE